MVKEKANSIILPIGSVAQALCVHPRTLRIWDEENILVPSRSEKNRRGYTFDDLEKGKFIIFMTRNLALNLSGVKIILAMLEKAKIKQSEYLNYIQKLAISANINIKSSEDE